MTGMDDAAFQELLGEIKSIKTDTAWMRKEIARQGANVKDLDERVRELEQSVTQIVAKMDAQKRTPVSWPAVVAAAVAVIVLVVSILDRIYGGTTP